MEKLTLIYHILKLFFKIHRTFSEFSDDDGDGDLHLFDRVVVQHNGLPYQLVLALRLPPAVRKPAPHPPAAPRAPALPAHHPHHRHGRPPPPRLRGAGPQTQDPVKRLPRQPGGQFK